VGNRNTAAGTGAIIGPAPMKMHVAIANCWPTLVGLLSSSARHALIIILWLITAGYVRFVCRL